MASVAQPTPAATCTPTPDIVGNAFVHQYYHILHQSPELVHRFYQDISKLGRPEANGILSITSTLQAINEKILSLDYGVSTAEITTVDTQESYDGGVLVLVTGYLTGRDNIARKFSQTFFLAPQEKGYFVLNDMFRYVDEVNIEVGTTVAATIETSIPHHQDPLPVQENHVQENQSAEQQDTSSKGVDAEQLLNPPENGNVSAVENEAPVPEVVDEIAAELPKVVETDSPAEEVSKRSYAAILKVMKENGAPVSAPRPRSKVELKTQVHQVAAAPRSAPLSDNSDSNANTTENGNDQNGDVTGPSIYLKALPLDATPALLETEFKKFGPIRSGGIQVRSQKGFCFGFVEFELANSVQSALEASPVMINGRRVIVEEKRSTSRGNSRARPYVSNNGYRGDGGRGRGNYGGGRGYGRGDFNHRSEYGNRGNGRGGYPNRDGMHRPNGGSRMSRVGGGSLSVSAAVKPEAPRLTATA